MSSNDIYTLYNIDKSRLKRDYIKNPLNRGETPFKEDWVYLYLNLNLSQLNLHTIFGWSETRMLKFNKIFNIKKPKQMVNQVREISTLKKYGVKNIIQLSETQSKIKSTKYRHFGQENYINVEKMQQTCLKKYGVKHPLQCPKILQKALNTTFKKYGNEHYCCSDDYNIHKHQYMLKSLHTKKQNNSIISSQQENEIYNLLVEKFGEVKRQYKTPQYPFACDFYIPSEDLYIEYQGYWSHGNEPYIGSNEQEKKVKIWKLKNTSQYNRAIKCWTIEDPLKRKTAKDNGLNWIEFFTVNDVKTWLNLYLVKSGTMQSGKI